MGNYLRLHKEDKNVKGVKFSRNFGHHVAVTAGIDNASGEVTVIMDADLQAQPEDIPTAEDNVSFTGRLRALGVRYSVLVQRAHHPSMIEIFVEQTRTNNTLERAMREIRRRTRVAGSFPDGRSTLMMAAVLEAAQ